MSASDGATRVVRAGAMTSLDEMAEGNAALREEMDDLLRGFTKTGTPAVKARTRLRLKKRKPAA